MFFNEKKMRKIQKNFDIENWLWKSEIGISRLLDLEQTLIWQKLLHQKFFEPIVKRQILNRVRSLAVWLSIGIRKKKNKNYIGWKAGGGIDIILFRFFKSTHAIENFERDK